MNIDREQVIAWAREACPYTSDELRGAFYEGFIKGAAAERNRTWTQEHWTEYERSIAAAEREACAKVCEDEGSPDDLPEHYAAAIRARREMK